MDKSENNKPKYLEKFNEDDLQSFIIRFQEIIFWRRPIIVFITFLIVELIFLAIYVFKLDFISTSIFLLLLFNVFRLFKYWIGSFIEKSLFKPLPPDDPTAPNRIRSITEVYILLEMISVWIEDIWTWFKHYLSDPQPLEHFLFYGTCFFLFMIIALLGSYWFIFLIVHIILIAPGLLCSPHVRNYIQKLNKKIHYVSDKIKDE